MPVLWIGLSLHECGFCRRGAEAQSHMFAEGSQTARPAHERCFVGCCFAGSGYPAAGCGNQGVAQAEQHDQRFHQFGSYGIVALGKTAVMTQERTWDFIQEM